MTPHEPTGTEAVASRRDVLRRKYWRLGTGELAAVVVFCLAGLSVFSLSDVSVAPSLWSALVPLLVVLVQAGVYWLLARTWVGRSAMPRGLALLYRVFRVANVAVLAAGLVLVIVWRPDQAVWTALVVAVWVFGVVEYVNYFHVRLSYPVSRWFALVGQWRTPQLVKDMRSAAP